MEEELDEQLKPYTGTVFFWKKCLTYETKEPYIQYGKCSRIVTVDIAPCRDRRKGPMLVIENKTLSGDHTTSMNFLCVGDKIRLDDGKNKTITLTKKNIPVWREQILNWLAINSL